MRTVRRLMSPAVFTLWFVAASALAAQQRPQNRLALDQ